LNCDDNKCKNDFFGNVWVKEEEVAQLTDAIKLQLPLESGVFFFRPQQIDAVHQNISFTCFR